MYEFAIKDIIAAIYTYGNHKATFPLEYTITPEQVIWILQDIDYWLAIAKEDIDGQVK